MWAVQYRSTDESENVWKTLIRFETEEEAIQVCRIINLKSRTLHAFRVWKIRDTAH